MKMKMRRKVAVAQRIKRAGEQVAKAGYNRPEDTTARVRAVLAQLSGKDHVVLGKAESDSGADPYEIRLGSNGSVYCTCKGWQYDKSGKGCKHLTRYRAQVRPIVVKKEA